MSAPAGYPLPWCDTVGLPYWRVNAAFNWMVPLWRAWQSKREMAEIIPAIDRLLGRFPTLAKRISRLMGKTAVNSPVTEV